VSKIEISYSLGSENSGLHALDLSKQRQQALLRNALMDLLQAVGNQAQSKPHRLGKGYAG
jgi:hypothetical protein